MAIAPALVAGNVVVIKPSEIAPTGVLELMRCVEAAGFPPGVVNVITGGPDAGQALIEHRDVAHVVFTGGTETARRIASVCGERLVRTTLELGGKSPNIVFADADLDAASAGAVAGIFGAAGQTCVAGSRLLVERSIYSEFLDRVVERARRIRLGDPMDARTQMGPISSEGHLKRIESMVDAAVTDGAEVLAGGERATVDDFPHGFFFHPTVLGGIGNDASIARNEVFGPVLAAIPFDDEAQAIEIANDTPYGLAAGVWTNGLRRAHRVARELEAGTVWINTYRALAPNSPFGGMKQSGFGRENGIDAVNEFLQTKSVWCELSDEVQDPFVLKLK
jgi:aldehyde dehydrogenase (NAD+)